MKFEADDKTKTKFMLLFFVIVASAATIGLFANIGAVFTFILKMFGYIKPVVYGFVLAFLLNPVMRKIETVVLPFITNGLLSEKTKAGRSVAILLTLIIVLLFFSLLMWIIIPSILASLYSIMLQLPEMIETCERLYNDFTEYLNANRLTPAANNALETLNNKIVENFGEIVKGVTERIINWTTSIVTWVSGLVSGIVNIVIGVIISIYFMSGSEKLLSQARKLSLAIMPVKWANLLRSCALDSAEIIKNYVIGAVLDALCVGVLCFIGMTICGWEYAMLISVIIACTNVIPYLGPFIGGVPSVLLLLTQNPTHALFFVVFILVLQQIDGNIINPRIVGDKTGLAPIWVVFALLFFGGLMGVPGMFIGVPLFAIIYMLVRRFVNWRIAGGAGGVNS